MISASVVFRFGGIGRRHTAGALTHAGADQRRRMEWRHRPVGDHLGGDMGVSVDRDDEQALSRLGNEQRSVDHHRAEAIARIDQGVANRIKVVAVM